MKTRTVVTQFPVSNFASEAFADVERIFDLFGSNKVYDERVYESPFDVQEMKTHYALSIDLPGVKQDEIKIEIEDGVMNVTAERKRANKELYFFKRSFTIPKNIDLEKIEAHYEDGVLEMQLPKVPTSKPLEITVQGPKKGIFSNLLGSGRESKAVQAEEKSN